MQLVERGCLPEESQSNWIRDCRYFGSAEPAHYLVEDGQGFRIAMLFRQRQRFVQERLGGLRLPFEILDEVLAKVLDQF